MAKKLTEEEREDLKNELMNEADGAAGYAESVASCLRDAASCETDEDLKTNIKDALENFEDLDACMDEVRRLAKQLFGEG